VIKGGLRAWKGAGLPIEACHLKKWRHFRAFANRHSLFPSSDDRYRQIAATAVEFGCRYIRIPH